MAVVALPLPARGFIGAQTTLLTLPVITMGPAEVQGYALRTLTIFAAAVAAIRRQILAPHTVIPLLLKLLHGYQEAERKCFGIVTKH
jgi:hypothetical protein